MKNNRIIIVAFILVSVVIFSLRNVIEKDSNDVTSPLIDADLLAPPLLTERTTTGVNSKNENDVLVKNRGTESPVNDDRTILIPVDFEHADMIEDEVIFRFSNQNELERFLIEAKRYGYEILGVNDKWHSIRLRLFDIHDFDNLINIQPKPLSFAPNYKIRIPDYINNKNERIERPSEIYLPFGTDVKKWLGISKHDHANGTGITVAVIDTGVDVHPTFRDGAITHLNLLDDSRNSVDTMATGGHGTAMASLIAGMIQEAPGMAPGASILSIRALDESGTGDTFTVALGILEAVDGGADVINASLGTSADSQEMREAVEYATDHDVMIVAASGNQGVGEIAYPARYEQVVAVGGIDPLEQHVDFSNVGDALDISAPSTGITAAWTEGNFVSISGTSPATAIVSGVIADLRAEYPDLSSDEINSLLIEYSNDTGSPGYDSTYGHGVPDINRIIDRNEPNIFDMALASQYHEEITSDGATIPLVVTAQNRGTEELEKVILQTKVGEKVLAETFFNVAVGETISMTVDMDRNDLNKNNRTNWNSIVILPSGRDQIRNNDAKSSVIIFNTPNVN